MNFENIPIHTTSATFTRMIYKFIRVAASSPLLSLSLFCSLSLCVFTSCMRVATLYMHREVLCLCAANDRARIEIESGFSWFALRGTDRSREDLPVPYMDSSRIHRSILRSILDYDSRPTGATFLAVSARQPEKNSAALPPVEFIFLRRFTLAPAFCTVKSRVLLRARIYISLTYIYHMHLTTLQKNMLIKNRLERRKCNLLTKKKKLLDEYEITFLGIIYYRFCVVRSRTMSLFFRILFYRSRQIIRRRHFRFFSKTWYLSRFNASLK